MKELQMDQKELQNMQMILTDILSGDTDLLGRPEFKYFTKESIQTALNFLLNNEKLDEKDKAYLVSNSWKINYRAKPPTPDEFITEKYIGRSAIHTYDRVKTTFCDFLDPTKPYRDLILYPFVGFGKSYLTTLVTLFIGTHLALMRNPYKFFGLNPASVLTQLLISYSLKKSSELLLEPMVAILESSPFFEKIHTREGMIKRDRDFDRDENVDKIFWTTAVPSSAIQLSNGANVKLASSVHSLLGLTVVSGAMSELAFFRDAGKSLTLNSKVMTPSGYSMMGDIQIGDLVLTPKGHSTKVIDVLPQGITKVYRVTFGDGRYLDTSPEHEWKVKKYKKWTIKNTQELFEDEVHGNKNHKWAVPFTSPLAWPETKHEISPYTLGVLLGGGSFRPNSIFLSVGDPRDRKEIVSEVENDLPGDFTVTYSDQGKYLRFVQRKPKRNKKGYLQPNRLCEEISRLNLTDKGSSTKFIPKCYFIDSIKNRISLLQGLLDTDGNVNGSSASAVYSTTSHYLKKDIIDLVRSLGGYATFSTQVKKRENYLNIYHVNVSFPNNPFPLFRLSRKQKRLDLNILNRTKNQRQTLRIKSIKRIADAPTQCITIEDKDHLFVAGQGVVTKNSDDYIMRIFNDLKGRIESRMRGNYFGRSILDSSPNTLDSPIDDYIVNTAHRTPSNFIVRGSRWDWALPGEFDMTKTFHIHKGGKGQPPYLIESDEQKERVLNNEPEKLIEVPSQLKQLFVDDIFKALKDHAGIPSGSADNLIYDYTKIERIFQYPFRSVYTHLKASIKDNPSNLLWDQISPRFFPKKADKHEFYYKPWIPRVLAVDQSLVNDVSAIVVMHVEKERGVDNLIYIVDLIIPIAPLGERISLDAIKFFIEDLRNKGNLLLSHLSFDQFQSEASIQYLGSRGFQVEKLSVDSTVDPYVYMLGLIETGKLFAGRNLHLKNNLKSIKFVKNKRSKKTKVDHDASRSVIVEGSQKWETSLIGSYAKDATDATAACCELLRKYHPYAVDIWEPETIKQLGSPERIQAEASKNITNFLSNMGLQKTF